MKIVGYWDYEHLLPIRHNSPMRPRHGCNYFYVVVVMIVQIFGSLYSKAFKRKTKPSKKIRVSFYKRNGVDRVRMEEIIGGVNSGCLFDEDQEDPTTGIIYNEIAKDLAVKHKINDIEFRYLED